MKTCPGAGWAVVGLSSRLERMGGGVPSREDMLSARGRVLGWGGGGDVLAIVVVVSGPRLLYGKCSKSLTSL